MDEVSAEAEIIADMDCAEELFNQLFADIAPTRKLNEHHKNAKNKISLSALTDKQSESIHLLGGYIRHACSNLGEMKQRNPEYVKLKTVPFPFLLEDISEGSSFNNDTLKMTTEAVLREFLVREMFDGECLRKTVKRLEDELTECCSENVKLRKKLESLDATQKKTTLESKVNFVEEKLKVGHCEDGDLLCTMFIRKDFGGSLFFGLVTRYNDPFYEVVYEDGDCEDVTKEEIVKLLWNTHVPSDRAKLCNKHFERLTKEKLKSSSSSSSRTSPAATSRSTPSKPVAVAVSQCSLLASSGSKRSGRSSAATTPNTTRRNVIASDDDDDNESTLTGRIVTTDSSMSLCEDLRSTQITLSTGQRVTTAALSAPSQIEDLDDDATIDEELSSSDNDDSDDSVSVEKEFEVIPKEEPVTATHHVTSKSTTSTNVSSGSSSDTSGEGSTKTSTFKAVPINVKRKLDQTSPAASTTSSGVKRMNAASWHTTLPVMAVKASGSDQDSDSDVVFIGSNPAPPQAPGAGTGV